MQRQRILIDPTLPVCWESTRTLRIGFDRAEARVHNPTVSTMRMIRALRDGIWADELRLAQIEAGATAVEQRALLDELGPVLLRDPPLHTSDTCCTDTGEGLQHHSQRLFAGGDAGVVTVLGEGMLAARLRRALAHAGFEIADPTCHTARPCFGVLVERFLAPTTRGTQLLLSEVPLLAVRVTDRSMTLGPVITAGGKPCLGCIELHGLEQNPLGPVLAAQLLDESPGAETQAGADLMAALVVAIVRSWCGGVPQLPHTRLRFTLQGGVPQLPPTVETITRHPECACQHLNQPLNDNPASAINLDGTLPDRPAPAEPEIRSSSLARVNATYASLRSSSMASSSVA